MKSLRKGIENYDRRRGWRGPVTNKIKNKNWQNIISQYRLDPTLNWHLAEITSLNNEIVKFKLIKKNKKEKKRRNNFKKFKMDYSKN